MHWIDTVEIWKSWSDHGRNIAAGILGCLFDWVLPTTNHLESFNNLLKNKQLRRWQRNGRRVRLDVLINILITKVLPSIFEQRSIDQMQRLAWEACLRHAGAEHLIKRSGAASFRGPSIAWLTPDETRDAAATALFERNQIGAPELYLSEPITRLTLQCSSAFALEVEVLPTIYTITLEIDGAVSCSCSDFIHRGGACKHIRAALKRLDALRCQGKNVPNIPIPTNIDAAKILEATRVARSVEKAVATADGQAGPLMRAVQVVDDLLRVGDGVYEEGDDAHSCREGEDDSDSSLDELLSDDEDSRPTIPSRLTLTIGAKGLEQRFDGASRRHLDRFISTSSSAYDHDHDKSCNDHPDTHTATSRSILYPIHPGTPFGAVTVAEDEGHGEILLRDVTYYCTVGGDIDGDDEKKELGRLPVLAVFHRMAHERGVPHSFVSECVPWGGRSGEVGC